MLSFKTADMEHQIQNLTREFRANMILKLLILINWYLNVYSMLDYPDLVMITTTLE